MLFGCVKQPSATSPDVTNFGTKGAFILCEGLYQMDNSLLSRYDFETNSSKSDYFSYINPLLRIGDTANDILIYKDLGFIAVTVSNYIQVFEIATGKSLGQIFFNKEMGPRKICIINDSVGYVTNLYQNSITKFNYKTLSTIKEIPVGPFPEGIAKAGNFIFVANSGFGDYYKNLPKSGTISVINVDTDKEALVIDNTPNAVKLITNKSGSKLYIGCYTLFSESENQGFVIEYDLVKNEETRRWKLDNISFCLSNSDDVLFVLNKQGVYQLELSELNTTPYLLIENLKRNENWYSIAFRNDELWIGNAKNYQINGEVIVFKDIFSIPTQKLKFDVGVNPNTIVFF